jgi:hypothetical protein
MYEGDSPKLPALASAIERQILAQPSFLASVDCAEIRPIKKDGYVIAYRWWSLEELTDSPEDFAPRRLPVLWRALARGNYPALPIDCGV